MKNGYAALVIIFIIGLVGTLLSLILLSSGYIESMSGRAVAGSDQAFFAAQSGVEEAFAKVVADKTYTGSFTQTMKISSTENTTAEVTVTGDSEQKTIKSVGSSGQFIRRIKTTIQDTSVTPQFLYGMQSGVNGIEIMHNRTVKADTGDVGVYSNGYIAGERSDNQAGTCKNVASAVNGYGFAVTSFDKTAGIGDSGICVTKDASANDFNYCFVAGKRNGPNAPSGSCSGGPYVNQPAPTPIPLPQINVQSMKDYLTHQGTTYTGNCTVDGTFGSCAGPLRKLGNIIITGNLTIPQNTTLTITGPVWVKQSIIFSQNVIVTLTGPQGKIVLTDQPILVNQNVSFQNTGVAYLLFISTYTMYPAPLPTPPPGTGSPFCNTPAIDISKNTNNVLFYAMNGCVKIAQNVSFAGSVVGEKIFVDNTGTITYDTKLSTAVFSISQKGGWQTLSFSEY